MSIVCFKARTLFCGFGVLAAATPAPAQSCAAPGYAIVVSAADGSVLDSAFLVTTARAIALRWQTPSTRRGAHLQWRRVRERSLPDIPRWADDWRPEPVHRAELVLVLRRRGRATVSAPSPASRDAAFDRSLESIVRDPMPASPEFPPLPSAIAGDTLALRVRFGGESDEGGPGVIRFASQQTAVLVTPGSLEVAPPRQPASAGQRPQATVKYDVTTEGQVDPRSIQILDADPRELGRNIQDALLRARFTPATTNCQAVRISVLQNFGG